MGRCVFVVVCLFIFLLLVFCPVVWWGVHVLNGWLVGCDGVSEYYSGDGFLYDVDALNDDYVDYGGTYQDTLFGLGFHPFLNSADDLFWLDELHFDCDDFSHAVKCLGKKYGVDCREVFEYRFPNKISGMWHFVTVCDGHGVFGMLTDERVYYG